MYSFGVVLWELITHDTPIRGRLLRSAGADCRIVPVSSEQKGHCRLSQLSDMLPHIDPLRSRSQLIQFVGVQLEGLIVLVPPESVTETSLDPVAVAAAQVPEQCPQDIADLIHDCLRSRAVRAADHQAGLQPHQEPAQRTCCACRSNQ